MAPSSLSLVRLRPQGGREEVKPRVAGWGDVRLSVLWEEKAKLCNHIWGFHFPCFSVRISIGKLQPCLS